MKLSKSNTIFSAFFQDGVLRMRSSVAVTTVTKSNPFMKLMNARVIHGGIKQLIGNGMLVKVQKHVSMPIIVVTGFLILPASLKKMERSLQKMK